MAISPKQDSDSYTSGHIDGREEMLRILRKRYGIQDLERALDSVRKIKRANPSTLDYWTKVEAKVIEARDMIQRTH